MTGDESNSTGQTTPADQSWPQLPRETALQILLGMMRTGTICFYCHKALMMVSKTVPREALAIICMPTGGRVLLKALRALTHLKQYYEIKTTYSLPFMDREPEAYGRKVMHPKALGW